MAVFPVVNGQYFSWSDIELTVLLPAPMTFAGVKAINYSDNLSKKLVYGTAATPIGTTKGRYEAKGDIELWLPQANLMLTTMGPGWKQVPINITASYVSSGQFGLPAGGLPQPVITDTIPGCFLTALDAAQGSGDEPLSRKFGLTITGQIYWNGIPSLIEPLLIIANA
jgi:hypothetical protein